MRWAWDSMFQHGRPDSLPPARTLRMFTAEFFRTRYYDYVDFRDMGPALGGNAGHGRGHPGTVG